MSLTKIMIYSLTALLLVFPKTVFAETIVLSDNKDGKAVYFDTGGLKSARIISIGDEYYSLSADAKGATEASYQVLFSNDNYAMNDWREYSALSFVVKNTGNSTARVQFNVRNSPIVTLTVDDTHKALWQSLVEEYEGAISPVNGMFEFAPGESGRLIIPFSSLTYKGQRIAPVGFFVSWNLLVYIQRDDDINLTFGDFSTQGGQLDLKIQEIFADAVDGDESVPLPITGAESIALYKTSMAGVRFSLARHYEGVSITPEGRLTISNSAKLGNIIIVATGTNEKIIQKRVIIGKKYVIPSAEEIPDEFTSIWYQEKTYTVIRLTVGVIAIFMLCFYGYGRSLNKKRSDFSGR